MARIIQQHDVIMFIANEIARRRQAMSDEPNADYNVRVYWGDNFHQCSNTALGVPMLTIDLDAVLSELAARTPR